eukprot:5066790-Amphidinium_carterae.1
MRNPISGPFLGTSLSYCVLPEYCGANWRRMPSQLQDLLRCLLLGKQEMHKSRRNSTASCEPIPATSPAKSLVL